MDILDFLFNLLLITILGLLIAFSPMLVIVNVLVILKSSRPILRTVVLMAGMILPLLIVAALAILFIHPDSQITFKGVSEKINIPPLFNLILGLWLVSLAMRRRQYSLTHNGPKKSVNLIMKHPPESLWGLFGFAFIKSILSVTNIFAILVLAKLIITNPVKEPLSILAVLWVILIGLIPFGVILYFYFFKHERMERLSAQVDKLLNRNTDTAINLALATVGFFLLFSGFIGAIRH